jgi:signal transduction histidine kinase
MALLEQIIQVLTGSPGNVIYHLVTLFSLQVVFALSLTHWRRDKSDHLMRRTMWASGAIFAGRFALLLAGLAVSSNPATAVSVLPPLEQAINTATAVLIVWALVPQFDNQPHLGDTIVAILLLIIGVMYIFFAQSWPDMALSGTTYNETTQATVWAVMQLLTLLLGVILTFTQRSLWFSLQQNILFILLLAYVIHLWDNPETISTQTDIAYWIRLGYLIAFPMWAAFIYRTTTKNLLASAPLTQTSDNNLPLVINLSTQVISSLQSQDNVNNAITMVSQLLPTAHIALALNPENSKTHLLVTSSQKGSQQDDLQNWQINLDEWPAFRQSLMDNSTIELTTESIGARQMRLWYEEMGMTPQGPLLIEPMYAEKTAVGLLLLGAENEIAEWSEDDKATAAALAAYFGQVIHNSNAFNHAADQIAITPMPVTESTQISGRIIALEDERNRLTSDLEIAQARLVQAENQATKASKQARDLAATLEELEQVSQDERVEVLETEIETLRESLIEAEEAMALAAADERGLSTEWIMTALTRYSSQLESAQARIQVLEADLMRRERGVTDELVISLAQELRTPMTSIAGYTDLLLSEMIGKLGEKQRDFLQRVKANVERMDAFLDLIVQLTTSGETFGEAPIEPIDVQTVLETAVSTVITQIREKNLHLDMQIQPDMPQISVNREALQQILSNLLGNACQVSNHNSQVAITATINELPPPANNGHTDPINFMHLAVTDSGGGINIDDRSRVFDPQYRADNPLIDGLGDTGAGLAVTRTLTEANGGRVWIESNMGEGSTFSVLFPISADLIIDEPNGSYANGTQ